MLKRVTMIGNGTLQQVASGNIYWSDTGSDREGGECRLKQQSGGSEFPGREGIDGRIEGRETAKG